jgi:outer membrane protein OmpA-like peptidoglycan-associated protein
MRFAPLACVAAISCIAAPAHAESGLLNLHLQVGLTAGASAAGLMGATGLDWQFHAPVALDFSVGAGHFGLIASDGSHNGVFMTTAGLRVRLFDHHGNYDQAFSNWFLAPRVGYLLNRNDDSSYAVVELETGLEFVIDWPVQLGPFARVGGAFGADDLAYFVVGINLSAELIRLPPPRPPPRAHAEHWAPPEDNDRVEPAREDDDSDLPDSDGDGVVDLEDACPDTTPGSTVDRRGCAVLAPKMVLEGITFLFDSAQIQPSSEVALERAAQLLRDNPSARVEIGGHTCDIGTDAYNQKLSEARAAAVGEWLVAHGIDHARLEVRGYGNTQPKVANDSEGNRALNRRIEFRRLAP